MKKIDILKRELAYYKRVYPHSKNIEILLERIDKMSK